jgi:dTDP-4-amino-4,6-dideoxygalactose transaminase
MRPPPDLGAPPPIPDPAQAAAAALLATGRLHRYGEAGGDGGPVAQLERAFAALIGRRYTVAVNSCGSALFLALKGVGVLPGDAVLMNAFTLGPAAGAVEHAGARLALVEITEDLTIDLQDLRAKAQATGARVLLLSHMRGHVCDMDALTELAAELGLAVIEDCAHTLGARWAGRPTGAFGLAGCFSLQSAKHVNAGEGGLLVTDDADLAARAILHSGSYMLHAQHGTVPPAEVMARWADRCGNYSLRMSALVATLALPQLPLLPARVADWNASHDRIAAALRAAPGFALPHRPQAEAYAQSSLQFRLPDRDAAGMASFVATARAEGVMVKWFGIARPEGYTSNPAHWPGADASSVPRAQAIQATLCDIRLPLGLTAGDCDGVAARLIRAARATEGTTDAPA